MVPGDDAGEVRGKVGDARVGREEEAIKGERGGGTWENTRIYKRGQLGEKEKWRGEGTREGETEGEEE